MVIHVFVCVLLFSDLNGYTCVCMCVILASFEWLYIYYSHDHLKPNPSKTQICCFHLRNRDAKHKLNVTWNGLELDHYPNPIYLGVTLYRTFKQHALNTKAKVNTRNDFLRKLTNPRRGAYPATVRTTALALCFSTADFACSS